MPDKIIITNDSALKSKYGVQGYAAIKAAVQGLIEADDKRGLKTVYMAVDNASAMGKVGGKVVTDASDPKQNKDAVDAISKKLAADYLMLLGAPDVIPHQDLKNPMYSPGNDDDKEAPGDIPYACEAPYSRSPEDFIGPSRVVGRLPDLLHSTDPQYLVNLLKNAAGYTQRKPADYASYFGISAEVWKASTGLSLQKTFGSNTDMQTIPPKTDNWAKGLISRRSHFINCHGADTDTHFYGQRKDKYPPSMNAKLLKGKITEGTVVSAECCFGAQLYDPANTDGQPGISTTYLREKAYGFFGSTTIAYGPESGNGSADLLCQFFLQQMLSGSSLGRAALEARQEFARSSPHISPTDLKTLAQFNLLGDPSITPVAGPQMPDIPGKGAAQRADRRRLLMTRGMLIAENHPVVRTRGRAKLKPSMAKQMASLARKAKIRKPEMFSLSVRTPPDHSRLLTKAMIAKSPPAEAFHVVIGQNNGKGAPVNSVKAVVAKVSAGEIVSVQELIGK